MGRIHRLRSQPPEAVQRYTNIMHTVNHLSRWTSRVVGSGRAVVDELYDICRGLIAFEWSNSLSPSQRSLTVVIGPEAHSRSSLALMRSSNRKYRQSRFLQEPRPSPSIYLSALLTTHVKAACHGRAECLDYLVYGQHGSGSGKLNDLDLLTLALRGVWTSCKAFVKAGRSLAHVKTGPIGNEDRRDVCTSQRTTRSSRQILILAPTAE
jgi:hypothetical protein